MFIDRNSPTVVTHRNALAILVKKHYMLAEGSAGLSVASLIKNQKKYKNKKVALIICGNKMKPDLIEQVLGTDII